jgi:DNA replication protein DnaC
MIKKLLALLTKLKLTGMVQALEHQSNTSVFNGLSFDERMVLLAEAEISFRDSRRLERTVRDAKFRHHVLPTEVECVAERGLPEPLFRQLVASDWVERKRKVIISGATGTGKSWLACALGMAAAMRGYSVRFFKATALMEELALAAAEGRTGRFRLATLKIDLLIIDDFGLVPMNNSVRGEFFDLIEAREGNCSTMFAGQLPFSEWHGYIEDQTIADAILDRVRSQADFIALKGQSWRES